MKPRLFLGSSSNSKSLAVALVTALSHKFDVVPWFSDRVFRAGDHILGRLQEKALDCELAVFLLTPDDKVTSQRTKYHAPRDNVIFELGLFLSPLGGARCFFIVPSDYPSFKTPSDLFGVVSLRYDPTLPKHEAMKQVAKRIVSLLAPENNSLTGRWIQVWKGDGSDEYPASNESEADLLHLGSVVTAVWPGDPDRFTLHGSFVNGFLTGTWRDIRGGFTYQGSFQLSVDPDLRAMLGRWLGFGRDTKIREGEWNWKKLSAVQPNDR